MEKWLHQHTPISTVEHDCIVSKNGDITVVFRADYPECLTRSNEGYEALNQARIKAVQSLPNNTLFVQQDYYINWLLTKRKKSKTIISKITVMRQFRFFMIVSLFCFGACHSVENSASDVRGFIPGSYVKEVKNEYTIAYDTLFIQCTGGNNFLIVNRTSFQPIRNGRLMTLKHSEVNMKALYDEASRNLNEQRLGKTFSFDPVNNKLFEGASPYNKIQL